MRPSSTAVFIALAAVLCCASPQASAGRHHGGHAKKARGTSKGAPAVVAPAPVVAPTTEAAPTAAPPATALPASAPVVAPAAVAPAAGVPGSFSWARPPGPIAGSWKVSCEDSRGMVVEVSVVGGKTAVGKVAEVGQAARFGYARGQEVLKLTADDYGDWAGQMRWRSVLNDDRWEPIRLVAAANVLNATFTTDNCYRNMPRVR